MLKKLAAAAALTAALLVPLTGCGSDSASDTPKPKPSETLAAAVTKTTGINVTFEMIDAGSATKDKTTGAFDATKKLTTLAGDANGEVMQLVITPDKLYLSGLKDLAGKTYRMQIEKIPAASGMGPFAAPMFPTLLLPAATTVKSSAAGSFSGTIDLAKVQPVTAGEKKFVEGAVKQAGARANAVTFTATVDAQGYLAKSSFTFPGMGDGGKDAQLDLTFAAFAAPVTVTEPTGANVIEAPDEMYTA
jgi:hypothetical protein